MAQRTKRKLPVSAYQLPGALAINHIRIIPEADNECGGLIEIQAARNEELDKLIAPRFVFLTTKNRKIGGDKPERGAFVLLQTMTAQGDDSIIILRGIWVCDKLDFLRIFKQAEWIIAEPGNKKNWDALRDDDLIVCTTWTDTGGLADAELTIAVEREGERGTDIESIIVRAISRNTLYGKTLSRSYNKLELIADATGKPVRRRPPPCPPPPCVQTAPPHPSTDLCALAIPFITGVDYGRPCGALAREAAGMGAHG